jgi:hypothetical protein
VRRFDFEGHGCAGEAEAEGDEGLEAAAEESEFEGGGLRGVAGEGIGEGVGDGVEGAGGGDAKGAEAGAAEVLDGGEGAGVFDAERGERRVETNGGGVGWWNHSERKPRREMW